MKAPIKIDFNGEKLFENLDVKENEWLDSEEASRYLRMSVGTLRNLSYQNKIPTYKVPKTRRNLYLKSELRKLILSSRKDKEYGS